MCEKTYKLKFDITIDIDGKKQILTITRKKSSILPRLGDYIKFTESLKFYVVGCEYPLSFEQAFIHLHTFKNITPSEIEQLYKMGWQKNESL